MIRAAHKSRAALAGVANPHAKRVARLRSALLKAVSPGDLREVVTALLKAAKSGDVPAAKELMQRVVGPAEAIDLTDRLNSIEQRIANITNDAGTQWHR